MRDKRARVSADTLGDLAIALRDSIGECLTERGDWAHLPEESEDDAAKARAQVRWYPLARPRRHHFASSLAHDAKPQPALAIGAQARHVFFSFVFFFSFFFFD